MSINQLNLFNEATPQSTATSAVLVRSHLRRVKGVQAPHSGVQAPSNGTATSRAAAESLSSEHLQAQEALVLRVVRSAGKAGLIREQIAALTRLELTDICRVVNGLAGATEGARKARRPVLLTDGPDTRKSSHGRGQKVVRVALTAEGVSI